jgi:DNA integrity scanning protein DisA with diadenylate cyclase activity
MIFSQINIYSLKDLCEIFFFAALIFSISSWLKKDRSSPLLFSFLVACILLLIAAYAQLDTIMTFILLYSPGIIMLLMLAHQQSLQKQLITFKKAQPLIPTVHDEWIDLVIRAALHARSLGKSFLCIIEQRDALLPLLDCPLHLNAPLQPSLLPFVIESSSFSQSSALLISQAGILFGINARFTNAISKHPSLSQDMHHFIAAAELLTQKTDALVLIMQPATAGCTLIANGSVMEQLTAKQAHLFLKQQLSIVHSTQKTKGDSYEIHSDKTSIHEQPRA